MSERDDLYDLSEHESDHETPKTHNQTEDQESTLRGSHQDNDDDTNSKPGENDKSKPKATTDDEGEEVPTPHDGRSLYLQRIDRMIPYVDFEEDVKDVDAVVTYFPGTPAILRRCSFPNEKYFASDLTKDKEALESLTIGLKRRAEIFRSVEDYLGLKWVIQTVRADEIQRLTDEKTKATKEKKGKAKLKKGQIPSTITDIEARLTHLMNDPITREEARAFFDRVPIPHITAHSDCASVATTAKKSMNEAIVRLGGRYVGNRDSPRAIRIYLGFSDAKEYNTWITCESKYYWGSH